MPGTSGLHEIYLPYISPSRVWNILTSSAPDRVKMQFLGQFVSSGGQLDESMIQQLLIATDRIDKIVLHWALHYDWKHVNWPFITKIFRSNVSERIKTICADNCGWEGFDHSQLTNILGSDVPDKVKIICICKVAWRAPIEIWTELWNSPASGNYNDTYKVERYVGYVVFRP